MRKYTDEYIIESYKNLCKKLDKTASESDIIKASKNKEICSVALIYQRFGSLIELQKIVGYKLNTTCRPTLNTKERILNKCKNIYQSYGRKLNAKELRKELKINNLSNYYKIVEVHSYEDFWALIEKYSNEN